MSEESVKTLVMTGEEVEILIDALNVITDAAMRGKKVRMIDLKLSLPPDEALQNVAGWLRRRLVEQNGGERIIMPWDFQEVR